MEPTVLYSDESMLVLDKPAGLIVNRSDTTRNVITIQDWVEEYLHIVHSEDVVTGEYGDPFKDRSGIVHRIDKETSGILLIAKTRDAFAALQRQFKERTVHKTYTALVHGELTPATGEIRAPVGRLPWNRKHFGIIAGGKEAVTKYKTLTTYYYENKKSKEKLSLVELYPETGRTHQIRVHVKYIGHPIFADELYGGRKTARDDRKLLGRVFLHAAHIEFSHPVTGERRAFDAPLPDELQTFLNTLQKVE